MTVDGFRFFEGATARVMRAWIEREPSPEPIPWAPLDKPLNECRVALLSSAGIYRTGDQAFDQERERRDPWWGDPSCRALPPKAPPIARAIMKRPWLYLKLLKGDIPADR